MKNSKSLLAILVLLTGAVTLTSCNKTKVTDVDGIEYTYVKEGNEKAPNGEFLLYNFEVLTESDSVLMSTSDNPYPGYMQANDSMPIKNGMDEIFVNLRKGDSIAFESTAKIIFGENLPPFLTAEDVIKIRLGAFEIMNQEALQAYFDKVMAAEEAEKSERAIERLAEEDKIIQEYIKENNLDAKKTESGLYYVIEEEGTGEPVTPGTNMQVNYAGYLLDGSLFDTSIEALARENNIFNEGRPYEPLPVSVGMGQVIPGWDEGLLLLKKGSKGKFIIPSPLGYGENAMGAAIPANSILVFDVDVADVQ